MVIFGVLDNKNMYYIIMILFIMVLWKNIIYNCVEYNNIIKKDIVKFFVSFFFLISLRFNRFFGMMLEIFVIFCSKYN